MTTDVLERPDVGDEVEQVFVTLTVADEDEVYDLQFGDAFAARATDPDGPGVERDDFALEIANMDE